MIFNEYTDKKAVQLLATQSRRIDISSLELCTVHLEMGKYLAYEILEELELEETRIQHVQGVKTGMKLKNENEIIIFPLMRAGLYAAEGIRSVIKDSQFAPYSKEEEEKLSLENKTIILVDSVINTGKSILKIIDSLNKKSIKKIIVATLILQKDALGLFEKYESISLYSLRVSENKYTGKGGTDTGNRLFNTIKRL
ncbi:uracil phosphoribosyltransferase [Aureispira sp. CCB-E]|uniref:uracil phosphoribosyltransferase n=1 Tax=Aureispira sp. CCB-E TaxID=3051121 RepID=UPI0028687887|nr:uracil phosphoribosyltransferase [Aureispira sp. CCB-E]WMX17173.1 uracil phosphoribosyltransferase [Aureispira sp. CCB-E]